MEHYALGVWSSVCTVVLGVVLPLLARIMCDGGILVYVLWVFAVLMFL
jgi:hypothetical protein